jgi:hypothetical protein
MAYRERQKISQMTTKGSNISATDLIEVSTLVSGSYVTKSLTGQEVIDGVGGNFVPYTGATQDVDLDTNKLSAESIYIDGTGGNGHLHMKHQSADATATGQSTALWADTNGDIKWKNDNDYKTTLKTSDNTADRIYKYPDESCTLAPREVTIDTKTLQYTLVLGDIYKMIEANFSSGNNIIIPTNAAQGFPIGTQILISQYGVGQVTIVPDTGVTLRSSGGKTKTAAQYAMATLIKRGTNEWYLAGDITT